MMRSLDFLLLLVLVPHLRGPGGGQQGNRKTIDTHVSWAGLGWAGTIFGTRLARSSYEVGAKLMRGWRDRYEVGSKFVL